jgi:PAS domain S-box-containing protein
MSAINPLGKYAPLPSPFLVSNSRHSGHSAQFYEEDQFLLESLSEWIKDGLRKSDAIVVIATQAHRQNLARRLKAMDVDIASASKQDRYIVCDASECLAKFMAGGMPDEARFFEFAVGLLSRAELAIKATGGTVAAFGEMVAVLCAAGNPQAALRLEHLWNDLRQSHSFSLWCAYPMSVFQHAEDSQAFLDICRQHSSISPSETFTSLRNEEERSRNIAGLQQRSLALETEREARKQTEQLLRRNQSELAEFLENAIEGAQKIAPDHKVIWANKALLHLLGYAAGEYVNRSFEGFCCDAATFKEFWRRLLLREDLYNFPLALRCKDGSVKQVMVHCNGHWEDGRFVDARCFVRDVTQQKKMETALRESASQLREAKEELEQVVDQRTAALRQLSLRILTLRDSERRRIARELHDSLGQYLVGLKLSLAMLRNSRERDELWDESEKLMQQCIVETRTLSYLLHPPMLEEAGLGPAVRWYVDGFHKRSEIRVSLDIPEDLKRLSGELELALFRVSQEALTNVLRHSGATEARVWIGRDAEQVLLEIADNGCGIAPEVLKRFHEVGVGMGIGLTGMRERVRELGGKLLIHSSSTGTSVTVVFPLSDGEAA